MKTNKIILTDVDGVLLDFNTPFHDFVHAKGHERKYPPNTEYKFPLAYGISEADANELYEQFCEDNMSKLPPIPSAVSFVPKLREAGYKFVAITAIPDTHKNYVDRFTNLENVFGKDIFIDLHLTGSGGNKLSFLQRYETTYWLEDHHSNANLGIEAGHQSILINYPFNTDKELHPKVIRKDYWYQIYDHILEFPIEFPKLKFA